MARGPGVWFAEYVGFLMDRWGVHIDRSTIETEHLKFFVLEMDTLFVMTTGSDKNPCNLLMDPQFLIPMNRGLGCSVLVC